MYLDLLGQLGGDTAGNYQFVGAGKPVGLIKVGWLGYIGNPDIFYLNLYIYAIYVKVIGAVFGIIVILIVKCVCRLS